MGWNSCLLKINDKTPIKFSLARLSALPSKMLVNCSFRIKFWEYLAVLRKKIDFAIWLLSILSVIWICTFSLNKLIYLQITQVIVIITVIKIGFLLQKMLQLLTFKRMGMSNDFGSKQVQNK